MSMSEDELPFEITHLGDITSAGLPIPQNDDSASAIAYDGTLVYVDGNQALRMVVFQPDRPPMLVQPNWVGATEIVAAIYSPTHRYLATRTKSRIRVYQMSSDRNLWGARPQPPVIGGFEHNVAIIFWKWLRPTCLPASCPEYLMSYQVQIN
ncbi:hypothetical protein DL93DRAFT_1680160 [Clavulina sp. PMI_390]|nr:hypothetical protein DL93DRAFT_1680160 [Clavulina sp. PMI_390]